MSRYTPAGLALVVVLLVFATDAMAKRVCTHGSNGRFEDFEKESKSGKHVDIGFIAEIEGSGAGGENSRAYGWVYYTLTLDASDTFNELEISLWREFPGVIFGVEVMTGATLLKEYRGLGSGPFEQWQNLVLPLEPGTFFPFGALVRILVGHTSNNADGKVLIGAVCVQS